MSLPEQAGGAVIIRASLQLLRMLAIIDIVKGSGMWRTPPITVFPCDCLYDALISEPFPTCHIFSWRVALSLHTTILAAGLGSIMKNQPRCNGPIHKKRASPRGETSHFGSP